MPSLPTNRQVCVQKISNGFAWPTLEDPTETLIGVGLGAMIGSFEKSLIGGCPVEHPTDSVRDRDPRPPLEVPPRIRGVRDVDSLITQPPLTILSGERVTHELL